MRSFCAIATLLILTPLAALAAVSNPHPGLTLVTHSKRGTLIVNLCAPGVAVRATRYDERKRTAKSFGQLLGLQAAINADFFDFPAATKVIGRAKGDNQWWPAGKAWIQEQSRPYWQFGPGLAQGVALGFDEPSLVAENIVGGHNVIMLNGQSTAPWVGDAPLLYGTHRRTGVGISKDRRTLYFTAVNQSINVETLIAYMVADAAEAGAPPIDYANNMDGGGSSQLWVQSPDWVISSTRQVANHLGVWASGSGAAPNCTPKFVGSYAGMSWPSTSAFGVEGTVQLALNETQDGWIKFTNSGDVPWSPGTTRLAPTPRDVPSPVASPDWIAPHRISGL
ncbi:MAG: hypothetical protein ACI9WU_003841, partial [Myxococcota bacterium]